MATSIDNFSWPHEFDADKLMRDYRSNSINIQPINKVNFKFTILPREACRGMWSECEGHILASLKPLLNSLLPT